MSDNEIRLKNKIINFLTEHNALDGYYKALDEEDFYSSIDELVTQLVYSKKSTDALTEPFTWHKTREGSDYWGELHFLFQKTFREISDSEGGDNSIWEED
jgi:hypothetical protein